MTVTRVTTGPPFKRGQTVNEEFGEAVTTTARLFYKVVRHSTRKGKARVRAALQRKPKISVTMDENFVSEDEQTDVMAATKGFFKAAGHLIMLGVTGAFALVGKLLMGVGAAALLIIETALAVVAVMALAVLFALAYVSFLAFKVIYFVALVLSSPWIAYHSVKAFTEDWEIFHSGLRPKNWHILHQAALARRSSAEQEEEAKQRAATAASTEDVSVPESKGKTTETKATTSSRARRGPKVSMDGLGARA